MNTHLFLLIEPEYRKQLLDATNNNNLSQIKKIINKTNSEIILHRNLYKDILNIAIYKRKDRDIINYMFNQIKNIKHTHNKSSYLITASAIKDLETVKTLIKHNCTEGIKEAGNIAIKFGQLDIIKELTKKIKNVESINNLIITAIMCDHYEISDYLISKYPWSIKDKNNNAIHYIYGNGSNSLIYKRLKYMADRGYNMDAKGVNEYDRFGCLNSPLIKKVVIKFNHKLIKLLLNAGCKKKFNDGSLLNLITSKRRWYGYKKYYKSHNQLYKDTVRLLINHGCRNTVKMHKKVKMTVKEIEIECTNSLIKLILIYIRDNRKLFPDHILKTSLNKDLRKQIKFNEPFILS